jgi:MATE family multidrug resistance protein
MQPQTAHREKEKDATVETNPTSFKTIIKVAIPLILQMSSLMVMQMIDTVFLSWYSAEAVAAAITAGLASWLIICVFNGTVGFTSTLVAQYVGAGQERRASSVIWHGIYLSFVSGVIIAGVTMFTDTFFTWAGHASAVKRYEIVFFNISCWGAFFNVAGAAISGFFSGRGQTAVLMLMQFCQLAINTLLGYVLIFGHWGFPEMGVAGAALATLIAQACGLLFLCVIYFSSVNRREFGTLQCPAIDWPLLGKLIKYGFPNGVRFFIDMLAWTLFPFFIGRIGTLELAASNIAFRINSMAFFPVLGLSAAVGILVGQAQGARRADLSLKIWLKGLLLGGAFTLVLALAYVLLPYQFYSLFHNPQSMSPQDFALFAAAGAMMLKMVAIYCLFDTTSIITLGLLQGAGDTRWTMAAAVGLYAVFLSVLFWIDHLHGTARMIWTAATIFIVAQSFIWIARLLAGRWKQIEMVEQLPLPDQVAIQAE